MRQRLRKRWICFWLIGILALTGVFPQNFVYARDQKENRVHNLKIYYYLEDTSKAIAEPYEAILPKGEEYDVSSPMIEGYSLKNQEQENISGKLEEDTKIEVFYRYATSKANYTVNYIGRSVDGTKERTLETINGEGDINEVVTIPDKEFEGWVREPGELSLTVTPDEKAVKNVYYTIKANPCIIFNTGGFEIPTISEKPGTDISKQIKDLPTPEKEGYVFRGWDIAELPTKMPAEDLIIQAKWEPGESDYTVLYWFENADDENYTLGDNKESRTAQTGSVVTANESDIANGDNNQNESSNVFYGFDYSHCDEVEVEADGTSVLNVYYKREIWKINYMKDLDGGEVWKTIEGKYLSSIGNKLISDEELKNYYGDRFGNRFAFMSKTPNQAAAALLEKFENSSGGGAGYGEQNIFPYFSNNIYKFQIRYFCNAIEDNTNLLIHTSYLYHASSYAAVRLIPPTGFVWDNGYYQTSRNESDVSSAAKKDNPKGSGANGIADFYDIYQYTDIHMERRKSDLTYVSNDEKIDIQQNIPYQANLKLSKIPENGEKDMKFGGWYKDPSLFEVTQPLTELTMPPTDLTLYAKWVPIDYTVTFDSHGGTPVEAQSVPGGKYAVMPEAPTKENYTFAGWYIDDNTRWNFDAQVTRDITLHALWKPIPAEKNYQIRHILQADNSVIAEYTGQGVLGDTITARALNARDKEYLEGSYIVPDALSKSIVLTKDGPNEAVFSYDLPNRKDYTVSYLLEGTEQILFEEKKVTDTTLSRVTELAEEIPGYTPKQNYLIADLTTDGENKIVFYYTEERSASLTISKTVTGEMGDKTKAFSIEIILQKEDGTPVKGSFPIHGADYEDGEQIAFGEDGNSKIALSDGQSVTIRDLEMGVKFSVEETPIPAGYQVTYNGTSSDTGIQGNLEETTKVSIVNAYDKIPVTALNAHIKSGAILILSAGILLLIVGCVMLYKRRKLH